MLCINLEYLTINPCLTFNHRSWNTLSLFLKTQLMKGVPIPQIFKMNHLMMLIWYQWLA